MGSPARPRFFLLSRSHRLESSKTVIAEPGSRPRVALFGPAFPLRGGISQYLALLHRALEPVSQVTQFSLIRQYPGFLFPGKTQQDESAEPLKVDAQPVLDVLAPWQWGGAAKKVADWQPDGLVYKWWLPFLGPAYRGVLATAQKGGATVVMIADNLVPHERRPLDDLFTRMVLRHTDAFIVQSASVEEDLHRLVPGARYRRVAHPVYTQYATSMTREEACRQLDLKGEVLLFFGFVRHYKGLDTLLDALPAILKERQVTLVVAGEFYEPAEPYRSRVRELGVEKHVRFYDRYLPDEEVRTLFAAADVCVLPYRAATQSGVIQVAYAAGCPVITTRVGGLPEFVSQGVSGLMVDPEDPPALAGAVLEFFGQGGRVAFEPGVKQQAKRYSWETLAAAVIELVREGQGERSPASGGETG